MTHARLPPPRGNLLIPLSSSAACRAGISMWSACRPGARAVRATAYHLVGLVGTFPMRLVSAEEWRPPVDDAAWNDLSEVWSSWFGPFDEVALYRPRQAERAGFAGLLLKDGRGVGFVKYRPDWDFHAEATVVRIVSGARSFMTPSLVGVTMASGWSTMGLSAMVSGLHSARVPTPPAAVAEEISELLADLHPSIPERSHWEPMHGDMGPWNLRYLGDVGCVLFDWEDTRRAPPGADLVFHAIASRAMRVRGAEDVSGLAEAAEFWTAEIPRRFGLSSSDQKLASQMLEELSRLS